MTDQLLKLANGSISLAVKPSTLGSNEGGKSYKARFVKAGRVLNSDRTPSNIEILAAALQRAVEDGKFEGKAVFVDHAGWFDYPSLTRLVGHTMNVTYNPTDQSVEGTLHMLDTEAGRLAAELVDELLSISQALGDPDHAPDVGLSMVFYPVWDRERDDELRVVTGVKYVESVDLVFAPAADGRILQALSSHSLCHCEEQGDEAIPLQSINPPNERNSPMTLPPVSPTETTPPETPQPALPSTLKPSTLGTQPTQLTLDSWLGAASQAAAKQILAASGLPKASQDRLASHTYESPDQLSHAIEAEKVYLASLVESQVIQIGGVPPRSPQISGMLSSLDRIQTALEAMLSGVRPAGDVQPLTGIRELYHLLSGDYEMSGVFHPDRIQLPT